MSNKLKKEIIEWVKTIAISLVIAFVITQFIRPTLVKGYSMYPTLEENDYLIINRIPYTTHEPSRGDIVVFKSHLTQENGKEKDLVKRVIAVPGDKIKIISGKVYVNDKEIKEPYINGDYTDGYIDTIVPEGFVFAMGDNRPNSLDSRDPRVGMVSEDNIIGRAFIRLYPLNKVGFLK
ncbi:signal peptidase I [Tepidibacter formicigenes]|uniref:Signal peptidase I n=1 Tax=Tepidibacter formicigenes DSM 15518 TaxID=1123349 RepID=A0A1M6N501_9FIRM|nr:signal peptidase I [Tepidibacter formicigenes]SHJ90815.1 signal peptidase I [Tepidibacter formicigenes DSM 15518]